MYVCMYNGMLWVDTKALANKSYPVATKLKVVGALFVAANES